VACGLPPPLLKRECDRLWQQPGLFDQVNNGQEDKLEDIHKSEVGFDMFHVFWFSLNYAAAFFPSAALPFKAL